MSQRLNFQNTLPEAWAQMMNLSKCLAKTSLNQHELGLIMIRASQVNGCAFCIDMHTKEARKAGETEQRIYLLNAWKEAPHFSERERALLALTEEVTLIQGHVKDDTFNEAVKYFGETGTAEIILAVAVMNSWNRIAISTELKPA